jgi:hypothetical protein
MGSLFAEWRRKIREDFCAAQRNDETLMPIRWIFQPEHLMNFVELGWTQETNQTSTGRPG